VTTLTELVPSGFVIGVNHEAPSYKPLKPKTIKPEKQAKIKGTNSIKDTTQLEMLATFENKPTNQI
jgi:hypothetical protein